MKLIEKILESDVESIENEIDKLTDDEKQQLNDEIKSLQCGQGMNTMLPTGEGQINVQSIDCNKMFKQDKRYKQGVRTTNWSKC